MSHRSKTRGMLSLALALGFAALVTPHALHMSEQKPCVYPLVSEDWPQSSDSRMHGLPPAQRFEQRTPFSSPPSCHPPPLLPYSRLTLISCLGCWQVINPSIFIYFSFILPYNKHAPLLLLFFLSFSCIYCWLSAPPRGGESLPDPDDSASEADEWHQPAAGFGRSSKSWGGWVCWNGATKRRRAGQWQGRAL